MRKLWDKAPRRPVSLFAVNVVIFCCMQSTSHAYYRSQSRMTDSGRYSHLNADLPSEIEALVAIVQGLVIDKDFVGLYGLALEEHERLGEVDTRYLTDICERLLAKHDRPLVESREPSTRFIGSCGDDALLLCVNIDNPFSVDSYGT